MALALFCVPTTFTYANSSNGAGDNDAARIRVHAGITRAIGGVAEVVVRESSDIFAIDDPAVSKALRFIQANAHRPISVDDIAQASGLFRRGLEWRFKEHLSQSIQQRCREVRASHLAKLIGESNLSLEAIAEQCGFS